MDIDRGPALDHYMNMNFMFEFFRNDTDGRRGVGIRLFLFIGSEAFEITVSEWI